MNKKTKQLISRRMRQVWTNRTITNGPVIKSPDEIVPRAESLEVSIQKSKGLLTQLMLTDANGNILSLQFERGNNITIQEV